MPYCAKAKRAAITPPKSGSHTVDSVVSQIDGLDDLPLFHGHRAYEELKGMVDEAGLECTGYAMHVREPADRIASAVNHNFASRQELKTLDDVVADIKRWNTRWFKPQAFFYSPEVELFPFEGFPILRWLGWEGEIPHEFKGNYRWSRAEIERHEIFRMGMEVYAPDLELRKLL